MRLRTLADIEKLLEEAERIGAPSDIPEGARTITLSDTVIHGILAVLRAYRAPSWLCRLGFHRWGVWQLYGLDISQQIRYCAKCEIRDMRAIRTRLR